jgi:hypothetical protein
MKSSHITIGELLRWRLQQAEAEAPPAPSAERLLALVCPWWETWPEQFEDLVGRLSRIQIAFGHAMTKPGQTPGGHPIPVLINHLADKVEGSARVLYLNVRDGQLRLRFHLDGVKPPAPRSFEATFVTDDLRPLFSATANQAVDSEYRIDANLAPELAQSWKQLKVTDRMPFRLILRDIVAGP